MKVLLYSLLILSLLGAFLGLIISFLSDILKVEEDEKVEIVLKMLPGYNCGACGKSGCIGLAKAIIEENESPSLCKPLKNDQKDKIIKYLKEK